MCQQCLRKAEEEEQIGKHPSWGRLNQCVRFGVDSYKHDDGDDHMFDKYSRGSIEQEFGGFLQ